MLMRPLFSIIIAVLWLVAMPARGEVADAASLPVGERGVVTEIVDGDTLFLDSGTQVRLVGIQAPKLPLGRAGFVAWTLGEEAKAALADLTLGRMVALHYGGRQMDRYGRALAHIVRDDGLWVQGALLAAGWARVYSFPDNRALVPAMLAAERRARGQAHGIWAEPFYAVRGTAALARLIDTFEVVEGRVVSAALVRGRAYLNFGADWKTDFTATVAPRERRIFDDEGWDLEALEGRTVRVRGWIKSFNGPMIEVTHPEQIEVFD